LGTPVFHAVIMHMVAVFYYERVQDIPLCKRDDRGLNPFGDATDRIKSLGRILSLSY